MADSVDNHLFLNDSIKIILFTDQKNFVLARIKNFKRIKIDIVEIDSLEWPNATLLRYKYYQSLIDKESPDYFMHIDADMLILKNETSSVQDLLTKNEMALVLHPGYWRSSGFRKTILYLKNPSLILKDLILICKYGSVGTWSKNKKSFAYVPRKLRKKYYCGGVWLGGAEVFRQLVTDLFLKTERDLMSNIIPIWHDESFLNKWATYNKFKSLPPTYCYAIEFKHLKELKPKIIAIDKNAIQ